MLDHFYIAKCVVRDLISVFDITHSKHEDSTGHKGIIREGGMQCSKLQEEQFHRKNWIPLTPSSYGYKAKTCRITSIRHI